MKYIMRFYVVLGGSGRFAEILEVEKLYLKTITQNLMKYFVKFWIYKFANLLINLGFKLYDEELLFFA